MMPVVAADDPDGLERAAAALRAGDVVAVPTDTVYGLAADPFCPGATDRLFEAKQRPAELALPVLVADLDQATALAGDAPDAARRLMARLWPGALTIVVAQAPDLAWSLTGDGTVGLRCPADETVRQLCRTVGPLAVTSANLHGGATPETAAGVADLFGTAVAMVLDGGPRSGDPSTVVDCTGPDLRLVRPGRLPWDLVVEMAG